MNTGVAAVPSRHGLLTTVGYQIGNEPVVYALEGSVAVAGAVITWLRDNLKLISSSSESEKIARSVPDSGDTVFVPAFNGLFAPHWRSDARGVLVGVSGNTTAAHIVRAAIEAVAFQSKELLDAMDADRSNAMKAVAAEEKQGHHSGLHHDPNSTGTSGGRSPGALAVDGGMTANDLLMQFQADITGKTVVKPVVSETTALGAAYAAGLAVGYWKSLEELRLQWSIEKTWQPSMPKEQVKKLLHKWNKAVLRSLGWAEDEDQESRKNK
jgi:glycerol kinase